MAIQLPDVGTGVPADQTGDSPWLAMKKVRENFNDQTNAASHLVGTAAGQVPLVGNFGIGGTHLGLETRFGLTTANTAYGSMSMFNFVNDGAIYYSSGLVIRTTSTSAFVLSGFGETSKLIYTNIANLSESGVSRNQVSAEVLLLGLNATKDANGFLKGASPVVDLYNDKIELNYGATQQGGITFEKLGIGDYLVKGSLGFAQEGWYIETPKDANGNVLVAVVYEQLANNDISVKTYAKRFDDETGDIVANLLKPRDIPVGRFISLRLHELPKEPPVMPTENQTEV